jgi:hypothetical protein
LAVWARPVWLVPRCAGPAFDPILPDLEDDVRLMARFLLLTFLAVTLAACATGAGSIARLRSDPRFHDKRVSVRGTVTTSWGVPLVPFKFYKIDDGTGELTVLSKNSRTPTRGAQVRVTGRLSDLAVLGGQPIGLHIEEQDLKFLRY